MNRQFTDDWAYCSRTGPGRCCSGFGPGVSQRWKCSGELIRGKQDELVRAARLSCAFWKLAGNKGDIFVWELFYVYEIVY